jgi:AraC-like DNA-binding protein
VRPGGVLGAVVAGFYDVTPSAYPERRRIFRDPEEALGWLGHPDARQLLQEVEAAQVEASRTPSLLAAFLEHVAAHPRRVRIGEVARALGTSTRTLQYQLRRAGTSFRREVSAARVMAAKRLLEEGETKLTAIAVEVGCASLQHFSTLFRKHAGVSPSIWRQRHRQRRDGS